MGHLDNKKFVLCTPVQSTLKCRSTYFLLLSETTFEVGKRGFSFFHYFNFHKTSCGSTRPHKRIESVQRDNINLSLGDNRRSPVGQSPLCGDNHRLSPVGQSPLCGEGYIFHRLYCRQAQEEGRQESGEDDHGFHFLLS